MGALDPAPAGAHAFIMHREARLGHVPSIDSLFARPVMAEPILLACSDIFWWEFRRGAWGHVFAEPTSSSKCLLVSSHTVPVLASEAAPRRVVGLVGGPRSIAELFGPYNGPTMYGDALWRTRMIGSGRRQYTPPGAPGTLLGDELWHQFSRGDFGHVLSRSCETDKVWARLRRGDLGWKVPGGTHKHQLWADFRRPAWGTQFRVQPPRPPARGCRVR